MLFFDCTQFLEKKRKAFIVEKERRKAFSLERKREEKHTFPAYYSRLTVSMATWQPTGVFEVEVCPP
jgi:hypothetical protein